MKAVILMFGTVEWDSLSNSEQRRYYDEHIAFADAVRGTSGCTLTGGEALTSADDATVVRRPGIGQVLTDGPYAEATEQLGGFYSVEAPDMDILLTLVQLLPSTYTLEIRPIWDVPDAPP